MKYKIYAVMYQEMGCDSTIERCFFSEKKCKAYIGGKSNECRSYDYVEVILQ